MYRRLLILIAKTLVWILRLRGSSGSALPGLIIEKLYPNFLAKVLQPHENKIVLVTGTNGKTTTSKMLVEALRGAGLRVVTNSTGSNMTRGLISALIEDMTVWGSLKKTDWFVFEMDEAYAPLFTEKISPKLLVGLNVLRDQLDRYGELDTTAKFIGQTAQKSDFFVYNGLDPLIIKVAMSVEDSVSKLISFGVSPKLFNKVSNEQTTHGSEVSQETVNVQLNTVDSTNDTLQKLTIKTLTSGIKNVDIPLKGFHNALNTTAVVAVLELLLSQNKIDVALKSITKMPVPFGRGERLDFGDKKITVALVKNPSGFMSNLNTFVHQMKPDAVLFVVNDLPADGRDVSWLWDVNFKEQVPENTKLSTSGIRGYDMALRLKHDDLESVTEISVPKAIRQLMNSNNRNIVIIPTYTALFEVRSSLSKYGKVPRIW